MDCLLLILGPTILGLGGMVTGHVFGLSVWSIIFLGIGLAISPLLLSMALIILGIDDYEVDPTVPRCTDLFGREVVTKKRKISENFEIKWWFLYPMLIGTTLLLGSGIYLFTNNIEDVQAQRNSEELLIFAKDRAPVLNDSLKTISQIRTEIIDKRSKLVQVLRSIGKSPEADADVRKYSFLLKEIGSAEQKLWNDLTDAYLAYKKFEISSDPAYDQELSRINVISKVAADEIKQKYQQLRQDISTGINSN